MRRSLALFTGLGTVLAAPAVAACPVCAQRQEGPLGTIALGVFIFMPWLIAVTVGHYIRKNTRAQRVESAFIGCSVEPTHLESEE